MKYSITIYFPSGDCVHLEADQVLTTTGPSVDGWEFYTPTRVTSTTVHKRLRWSFNLDVIAGYLLAERTN